MTFTESDAENDGMIKREAGREMAKVAQQVNPEVYQHFLNVCENRGVEPPLLLGEMAVRALNDEGYANRIFNTEVNMSAIQQNEIRKEDVQFVTEIESMFKEEDDGAMDPIDELIEDRIRNMASSPVKQARKNISTKSDSDEELKEFLAQMNSRMEQMEEKISSESQNVAQEGEPDGERDLDDLFEEEDEPEPEPEPEPEEEEVQDEVEVQIDSPTQGDEAEEEPQEEVSESEPEDVDEAVGDFFDDVSGMSEEDMEDEGDNEE